MRSGHQSCSCCRRGGIRIIFTKTKKNGDGSSVRVLCGDLERGDGFQAGLDILLLSTVPDTEVNFDLIVAQLASDVVPDRCLGPVDGALRAAATLALAALGAGR